jgi:uncharacterized membrane protein
MITPSIPSPEATTAISGSTNKSRIASIDIMRGLVILLMMVDHVRERFFYHLNVSDPMDLDTTSNALFFTRMTAHLCAPTFVFLSGMSAWLYAHPAHGGTRSPSSFLLKRGLFLVFIELTLINFSWFGNFDTVYLQVIWAIGISMIALSVLVKLPFKVILFLGLVIVCGHNLLSPISFQPNDSGYTIWAILHDRGVIYDGILRVKASYPVLPWIGVILLGYSAGPIYARAVTAMTRRTRLVTLGISCLLLLLVLRGFNLYGEVLPWSSQGSVILSIMDFVNFTKYPPSLDFVLLTVGIALLLLAWFETLANKFVDMLEVFGSAPMFIYILHLYVLLVSYKIVISTVGPNSGDLFVLDAVWQIWGIALLLVWALYYPTRAFARFKHSSNQAWVKYL